MVRVSIPFIPIFLNMQFCEHKHSLNIPNWRWTRGPGRTVFRNRLGLSDKEIRISNRMTNLFIVLGYFFNCQPHVGIITL